MDETRYCIISDGDGHEYICPADKQEEALAYFADVDRYWSRGEYHRECPTEPDYLRMIGGSLTFIDPQF